jgi:hypothetical protein
LISQTPTSIPAGIDFAFCLEPVVGLAARCKAALFRPAIGKVADPLVPFRRGQPVRNEKQWPHEASLAGGSRCGRLIPWNPCACNFARHTFLPELASNNTF